MPTKPFLIFEYILSVLKKYDTLRKQYEKKEDLRVIDIRYNQWDECILKIQVTGKATVFDCTPKEIAEDDAVLGKFSTRDIRTISYLATQEITKPQYKVLAQDLQENTDKVIFKLSKHGSPQHTKKSAEEIALDKQLLNQLSQKNAYMIGYTVGIEQMLKEKKEIERLKKQLLF